MKVEHEEAAAMLAEWEAEAARRVPAWEHALKQQNLDPKQLLTRAAGALAGRDVTTQQYLRVVDQLSGVVGYLHYLSMTGQISNKDWDIFEGLLGEKIRRSLSQQASDEAHRETRQFKTEVGHWLREQRPQTAAILARQISEIWPIKLATAIRWERAFRQAQAAGSP